MPNVLLCEYRFEQFNGAFTSRVRYYLQAGRYAVVKLLWICITGPGIGLDKQEI